MLPQLQSLLEKLKSNPKEIRDLTERGEAQNVDKCKRVLEWLPATSEPVSEEVIKEDSEFFTNLLSILEEVIKKLEEQEQLEVELQEVKMEKE
ncbi:10248_t:CDS:2, partial [Racocetra persica]